MKIEIKTKSKGRFIFIYKVKVEGNIYLCLKPSNVKKNIKKIKIPHHFKTKNIHFSKIDNNVIVTFKHLKKYIQLLITKESYFLPKVWDVSAAITNEMIPQAIDLRDANTIYEVLNLQGFNDVVL